MTRRPVGPAARFAYDPAVLVAYLDVASGYLNGGNPRRRRLHINLRSVSDSDRRVIRRWRSGKIAGVTADSATALLERYGLPIDLFVTWAQGQGCEPVLRGQMKLPLDQGAS